VFRVVALPILVMCAHCAGPPYAQTGTPGTGASASASRSTVEVVPNAMSREGLLADAVDSVTIAIALRNDSGEPLANMPIQFAVSGSRNVVTPAAMIVTDAKGGAILNLTSTAAETKILSVIANPGSSEILLDDRPSVTFVAPPEIRAFFDEVARLEDSTTSPQE
jgi:Bacterial Ig-like domain (group 1)